MDPIPSLELIEANHSFPGQYRIKAIGSTGDDFVGRVLAATASEISGPSEVESSVRKTQGGRHVAITLDVTVQTAEQVRAIYARLHREPGLTLLF